MAAGTEKKMIEGSHRSLDAAQIADFQEQGYLRVGAVFDGEQLTELQSEYDRVFAEARESSQMRNLSSSDGEITTEADEELLQIMQVCERSMLFRRLLYDERVLDIAEDLIGPNLQLFHDQALFKPAHHGGPISWHQDNAYWRCEPANLVSCWMTLDDVDVDNGAMQVIPGSHRGALEHEREDDSLLLDHGEQVDDSDAVIVELPAGGIMFHHCQTLHHTARNTTDRQRRAFAIHFMNPGTRRSDATEMEVSFSRPLLRLRA